MLVFPGENSLFPKAFPQSADGKLLLSPFGGPEEAGLGCTHSSGWFPRSSSWALYWSALKSGGRTFWGKKSNNILLVARVTFMLCHKTSLGATVRAIIRLVCQFQWHFLCFYIMLLRLQSVDSNHCQRDHLRKQRETWASNTPNLKCFLCSKQYAPAEVWVGGHQCHFGEELDCVSPCFEQGPNFHSTSMAVRLAFIFFRVCACVCGVFAWKAITPLIRF